MDEATSHRTHDCLRRPCKTLKMMLVTTEEELAAQGVTYANSSTRKQTEVNYFKRKIVVQDKRRNFQADRDQQSAVWAAEMGRHR